MKYPSISNLIKGDQTRYSLVIATAKRARQIAEEAEKNQVLLTKKPVMTALEEIESGKVIYYKKDEQNKN